jgi:hypothetical protein
MKKKKLIIAIVASLAVIAALATATFFAIFKDDQRAETSLQTGKIDVQLIESFKGSNGEEEEGTDPDGYGLENATKIITGENTGTQPAYVRVKIFPQIESCDADGAWSIFGGIPTNYVTYDQDDTDWVDGGDGYYYYTKILPVGETTSPITITNLSIDAPDLIMSNYTKETLRVNMLVKMEATEASNELYKLNWSIDSLPSGVETME